MAWIYILFVHLSSCFQFIWTKKKTNTKFNLIIMSFNDSNLSLSYFTRIYQNKMEVVLWKPKRLRFIHFTEQSAYVTPFKKIVFMYRNFKPVFIYYRPVLVGNKPQLVPGVFKYMCLLFTNQNVKVGKSCVFGIKKRN